MASKTLDDNQENTCVVCFKGVEIYSIGQCDHPVCYECSTRMRVLCRQNECPICRQDMPKVIFTKSKRSYNSLQNVNGLIDKKFKVVFETEDEKKAYEWLLAHECPECSKVFMTFIYLRDHVRRVHQLNYCELCVENLRIYSKERRCYNRAELAQHRKDGDPDNRSHRGHPLCEFCDTRYMDNDELYRHLRRDHLYCHFCDADGLHQYYSSYDYLRDHFRSEHYLCEEGDCINEKFTAVFRSDIDLKAHRTTVHGRGLGKAGLKQARTLDLEFTLVPRARPTHPRPPPRSREEEEMGGAVGGQMSGQYEEETRASRSAPALEEFPALGGEQASTSLSLRLTSPKQPSVMIHTSIQVNHPRFTTKVTSENSYNQHFPALGNGPGGEMAVTSVSWSACSGPPRKGVGGEQQRGSGLPPREDFPSLGRTSTGVGTDPPLPPPPAPAPAPSSVFVSVPTKTKKKKTKSKSGGESNPLSTPASALLLPSGESKSKKNKKEAKPAIPKHEKAPTQSNNNIEKVNHNNNVESMIKAMSVISEKPKSNSVKEVRKGGGGGDEFPTLGAPPGFSAVQPIPPPENAPRWEIKKPPKPPPGLGKPPPGLPPPGFSGLNGGFPPLIGGPGEDDDDDDSSISSYITPNNFNKRNTSLVKLINSSLLGETLDDFKQISVAFRNGSLPAAEYYMHCKDMLGAANFKELFPELMVLLPDIDKQQELWKTYRKDRSVMESRPGKKKGGGPKVEECATCGQILRTSDLRDHLARHTALPLPSSASQVNPWAKLNF